MNLKDILHWRYSTKKFDEEKPLNEEQINHILELTNLSASSYGMQPFKMVVVKEQSIKRKLLEYSHGQTQIADSSHLIVFAARTDIDEAFIDTYVGHVAEQRNVPVESLAAYKTMLMNYINKKEEAALFKWASDQIYIALGSFLIACASEKVDACPIGGFTPNGYDEVLKLHEHHLKSVVVAVIGYRHKDDKYQYREKVRRPLEEMVVRL